MKKGSKSRKKLFGIIILLSIFLFILFRIFVLRLSEINGTKTDKTIDQELTPFTYCQRTKSHGMPPRFQRALNLLLERNSEINPRVKTLTLRLFLHSIAPCLFIQYCLSPEMADAEGWFYFMPEHANRDSLLICVSSEYIDEDDIFTAILLAHEITHAIQWVLDETNTTYGEIYNNTCYGKEAMAYTEQLLFIISLTNGEFESVSSRLRVGKFSSRIAILTEMINLTAKYFTSCEKYYDSNQPKTNQGPYFTCLIKSWELELEKMVRRNPYYQKQCSGQQ